MAEEIIDGTGSGKRAQVDKSNRLHVHSVGETIAENASQNGDSYNINTGLITMTDATDSSLLYFKNQGENDLQISAVGYLLGGSTGGSGNIFATIVKNPTGGTIVSDAIDVAINQNKNAGSSNMLNVLAYKGGTGKTSTGGQDFYYSLIPSAGRTYVVATGNIVLPTGSSIAVKVQPQTGNTSMDVQIFLAVTEYKLG